MWIFGPPPPGGPWKNSELNVHFFWHRLYSTGHIFSINFLLSKLFPNLQYLTVVRIMTMSYQQELKFQPYLGQGRPPCQRSNHSNRRAQTNTPTEKQTDPISRTNSLYPGFAKLLMKNIPVLHIQNVINWGNIIPFHFIHRMYIHHKTSLVSRR